MDRISGFQYHLLRIVLLFVCMFYPSIVNLIFFLTTSKYFRECLVPRKNEEYFILR